MKYKTHIKDMKAKDVGIENIKKNETQTLVNLFSNV